jgi:hypothetical protein
MSGLWTGRIVSLYYVLPHVFAADKQDNIEVGSLSLSSKKEVGSEEEEPQPSCGQESHPFK